MKPASTATLLTALNRYTDISAVTEINNEFARQDSNAALIKCYEQLIPLLEQQAWAAPLDNERFSLYQAVCREMEQHLAQQDEDARHHFILVIPVADRPKHLATCLHGVYALCESFAYGGRGTQGFNKITVVIADDSQQQHAIQRHQQLAEEYTQQGLMCIYFGQAEQLQLIQQYDQTLLDHIIGRHDAANFSHKGASATRNITYLYLKTLADKYRRPLFYFFDSDQEFRLNITGSEHSVIGLNYFYHLDKLFRENTIRMLTGKVVGDPPVSPAVMAANFLQDVSQFISAFQQSEPEGNCRFHTTPIAPQDDAAYHDMAELFGFNHQRDTYHYACPLQGTHSNQDCFTHFCAQLMPFFAGEHPTRHTDFTYQPVAASLRPARTVYTGNYIFTAAMLAWFIPFADLKLRMAGPLLGRLIRAALGEQFVSANLPMLHKRTPEHSDRSEYRPGVDYQQQHVDLSAEFERQFFGDLMLFTIEALTEQGYPQQILSQETIFNTLQATETRLLRHYRQQHQKIKTLLQSLTEQISDAPLTLQQFIDNMQHNFGTHAKAYRRIEDAALRRDYRDKLCKAIMQYPQHKLNWQSCLLQSEHKNDEYLCS